MALRGSVYIFPFSVLKWSYKKMAFCFENSSTYIGLLFILVFLLYQIGCDKTEDELLTEEISCLILRVKLFHMKGFCILCISSIICFEKEVVNVRCTILDSADVQTLLFFPPV